MLFIILLSVLYTVNCATYQRFETTYGYPSSTVSYNNGYKTGTYGNDLANFPEATRYPNYSPGISSTRSPYDTYSTNSYNTLYSSGSSNVNYNQGYNLGRPGDSYGRSMSGYGNSGYGSSGYGSLGYGNSGLGSTGYTPYEMPFMRDITGCVNRSPQNGIYVDSLMGMWYGVELVQHLGADTRIDYARTCIVIHIAEPKDRPSTENQLFHVQHINARFRQEYRHLRLLWDEAGLTTEYSLYFRNDSAGYWHVFNGQNGTMTTLPNYQHFSGTVQVLKAVSDHLVLNFCQEAINGRPAQLYSVLFSRNPGEMNRWEIDSVHGLLQSKKLSVASRRLVCGNSGDRLMPMFMSFLTCLLAYVIGKS